MSARSIPASSNTHPETNYAQMKITLTTSQVAHHLLRDEYARWSYEGAYALARHYEEREEDSGEEMELDVVAIRCEWSEFKTLDEIYESYRSSIGDLSGLNEEERHDMIEAYLTNRTTLLTISNGKGYLLQQF